MYVRTTNTESENRELNDNTPGERARARASLSLSRARARERESVCACVYACMTQYKNNLNLIESFDQKNAMKGRSERGFQRVQAGAGSV